MRIHGSLRFPRGVLRLLPPLAVALAAGGCPARWNEKEPARLAERYTIVRLDGVRWRPCETIGASWLVPRTRCGGGARGGHPEMGPIAEDADTSSPAALRGLGLRDLQSSDTLTQSARRAVETLERARRLDPANDTLLNELAAAYVEFAARTQEIAPMLHALDVVEQAASRDSLRPATLFNRGLIRQRLYLLDGARDAWTRFRAVEREPGWLREGEERAALLRAAEPAVRRPDLWTDEAMRRPPPPADVAAAVRSAPQAARELAFRLFGEWGRAELRGDQRRTARLLSLARQIASAAAGSSQDRTVALWLAAIDASSGDRARLHRLARGHADLQDGLRHYAGDEFAEARSTLARAEQALREARSPAARWALFYRAGAEVQRRRYTRADRLFRQAIAGSSEGDEPALAGKSYAGLGLSHLRRGDYASAIAFYQQAAPLVARANETENEGSVVLMLAEALTLAGQLPEGRRKAYDALRLLSPYRSSNFLANHLSIVASHARRAGLPYAALALRDERVKVARRLGRPGVLALALCERASDLLALGRDSAARADVREAMSLRGRIAPGADGTRLRANVDLAAGQFLRARHPEAALPLLARAVESYSGSVSDLYLPVALYEAALAAMATGDTARARGWLVRAVAHTERQHAAFQSVESRASFDETVENVFDAMIGLELDAGRPESAFEYLERNRAVWPKAMEIPVAAAGLARIGATLPRGTVLLEYALLDREVVAWTASRRGTAHRRIRVSRDSVAALVARLMDEAGTSSVGPGGAQTRLYDLLLRPFEAELSGAAALVVIPDRELNRLPFAALRDGVSQRYVVQDHEVRTVPSAAFFAAARARPRRPRSGTGALVVGNPALGDELSRDLLPLLGAAREADSVSLLYPRPAVLLLSGADATRERVRANLPRHAVFHFAGHAVFDPEQPERSFLALAPSAPEDAGRLRAGEIGGLGLSRVDVAVLSACSTLSPRATRTGPAAGLAYSFLHAGVPATVSTVWDVADGSQTALLVEFHRRLAAGEPVPAALRAAQAHALAVGRPPRTWAAFIYTGP